MILSFFFRRPSPVFHSIEEQFFAEQKELTEIYIKTPGLLRLFQ